jgi:hypothetical protein
MTSKQREAALPQVMEMLGRAAADRIVREGAGGRHPRRLRSHRWDRAGRTRIRLAAMLAVTTVGAAVAVSAGAFDRGPVAPQLGPAESGVNPGVVPGEVRVLHGPNGEKIQGGVSPCIKSDPSGYSTGELEDPEWCFHKPGEGSGGQEQEPRAKVWHRSQYEEATP